MRMTIKDVRIGTKLTDIEINGQSTKYQIEALFDWLNEAEIEGIKAIYKERLNPEKQPNLKIVKKEIPEKTVDDL